MMLRRTFLKLVGGPTVAVLMGLKLALPGLAGEVEELPAPPSIEVENACRSCGTRYGEVTNLPVRVVLSDGSVSFLYACTCGRVQVPIDLAVCPRRGPEKWVAFQRHAPPPTLVHGGW